MSYTLVVLRHGQSTWNLENRFTGWTDVGLTQQGKDEARQAGRLLSESGFSFDLLHTSLLARAIQTANLTLEEMGLDWVEVERTWRLNERHYGALQGLDKKETAAAHGKDQVFAWRRGYDTPPPPLTDDDERHPRRDPRYAMLAPDVLPATECLKDVVERMMPYWYDMAVPALRSGRKLLIAAHGNSLRALVKHLEGIPDDVIPSVNIPTGVPRVYRLDGDLRVESAEYLGDPDAIEAAVAAVAGQAG